MKDEDNYRFSTRLSKRHKIKLDLLKIKKRRLVETSIDEASSNTERFEKVIDYHLFKNRLKEVQYEIEKLQLEENLLKDKIELLEIELRDSSEKLNGLKVPEDRQAIKIVQKVLHRKRQLYLSERITEEQIIINFVKDNQEFINATFNAPYVTIKGNEEIIKALVKYIDFEKIKKTDPEF